MPAIDAYYKGLTCELSELSKESAEFISIEQAVKGTHAVTHSTYRLDVLNIYECSRHGELERFNEFLSKHSICNRRLLWHGSRLVSSYFETFCYNNHEVFGISRTCIGWNDNIQKHTRTGSACCAAQRLSKTSQFGVSKPVSSIADELGRNY